MSNERGRDRYLNISDKLKKRTGKCESILCIDFTRAAISNLRSSGVRPDARFPVGYLTPLDVQCQSFIRHNNVHDLWTHINKAHTCLSKVNKHFFFFS